MEKRVFADIINDPKIILDLERALNLGTDVLIAERQREI